MSKKAPSTKAVIRKEKKQIAKETEIAKKHETQENTMRKDSDKKVLKKQQKKEEQDRKKQEQLKKKAEIKALLQKEEASTVKAKKLAPVKVTRAEIVKKAIQHEEEKGKNVVSRGTPLVQNINRLEVEGEVARTINEAIAVLNNTHRNVDRHPEKRLKAAFEKYEARRLNELKSEKVGLRLSQIKEQIWKDWNKSSENPLNHV